MNITNIEIDTDHDELAPHVKFDYNGVTYLEWLEGDELELVQGSDSHLQTNSDFSGDEIDKIWDVLIPVVFKQQQINRGFCAFSDAGN